MCAHSRAAMAVVACLLPFTAAAEGWETKDFPKHKTWIFTPGSAMAGGKRGLMVALHGCAQDAKTLAENGNFEPAAKANGFVVAVPDVGPDAVGQGCWNYNVSWGASPHVDEIIAIAEQLAKRPDIDPAHVYVVGLSSGAGLSLALGCKAPHLFAGVGAVEGPSVGSFQGMAFQGPLPSNVSMAIQACKSLAGQNASWFASQIANVSYGDMDKGGRKDIYPYSPGDTSHPGQYSAVPIQWTLDNASIYRALYNAEPMGSPNMVAEAKAVEWHAKAGGKVRMTEVEISDLGHAWPTNGTRSGGGLWIAQGVLDYPSYITAWFVQHNLRAERLAQAPRATAQAWNCVEYRANNFEHVRAGRAYDWFGLAYANGSNTEIGPSNIAKMTGLAEREPGKFTPGPCGR